MKKRLILSGATVLLLIILASIFFILAKKYSPLISHQPLNNNQNNQLETPNIESIGSINVDNQNFDIKLNAIKDGIVVAENGQPTRNDSEPKSPGTPMVSLDINGAEGINIPNDVIKISITKVQSAPNRLLYRPVSQPLLWLNQPMNGIMFYALPITVLRLWLSGLLAMKPG